MCSKHLRRKTDRDGLSEGWRREEGRKMIDDGWEGGSDGWSDTGREGVI